MLSANLASLASALFPCRIVVTLSSEACPYYWSNLDIYKRSAALYGYSVTRLKLCAARGPMNAAVVVVR